MIPWSLWTFKFPFLFPYTMLCHLPCDFTMNSCSWSTWSTLGHGCGTHKLSEKFLRSQWNPLRREFLQTWIWLQLTQFSMYIYRLLSLGSLSWEGNWWTAFGDDTSRVGLGIYMFRGSQLNLQDGFLHQPKLYNVVICSSFVSQLYKHRQSIQVFRAIVDSWKFYFHKYLLYRISLNGDVHIFTGELF